MKRPPRGATACAVGIIVALMVHALATRLLAGRDLVAALTTRFDLVALAAALALLVARLFVLFLAPGWVLYLFASGLLARRSTAQPPPPAPPSPPPPPAPSTGT